MKIKISARTPGFLEPANLETLTFKSKKKALDALIDLQKHYLKHFKDLPKCDYLTITISK